MAEDIGEDPEKEEEGEKEKETSEIFERYLEDIKSVIDRGYYETPRILNNGWLYMYDSAGNYEKVNLRIFSPEEQQLLLKTVQQYARELRRQKRQEAKQKLRLLREAEEEVGVGKATERIERAERREAGETKRVVVGTGRRETLEQLDRSHAKIVRNLTEATGWFADVLHEVGFFATLIAMQMAKVPPEELYDRVVDFKNPREFASFVKDHLAALSEAMENANAVMDLRQKLDAMDAKVALIREVLDRIKNQRNELTIFAYTALSSMCEDCMKRFMLNWMAVKYGFFPSPLSPSLEKSEKSEKSEKEEKEGEEEGKEEKGGD